jgi:acetyl-CoA C-acetyltransferase
MKVPILGVYQTKFGELWEKSLANLIFEAGSGALVDAGLSISQIDAIFIGNMLSGVCLGQEHIGSLTASVFNTRAPVLKVEAACASGGMAVRQAVLSILSSEIETALVIGVEKMTDLPTDIVAANLMSAASPYEKEAGFTFPGLYAILANSYLSSFGATERDLANVAVKNHKHASLNGNSHLPFEISVEQVLLSTKVAHPLKLLDCSPISDGGAAVVLASKSFIKKTSKKNGVAIIGSGQASDTLGLSERQSLLGLSATKEAGKKAFFSAGVEPADISLAEVHDCFTIAEILALEDLGFYEKGEGFVVLRNGEVQLGGRRPINTSGGLKACGHPVGATGVKQIVEATLQLRNGAGGRQVKDAKACLTHNVGGTGGTCVVHILAN